MYNRIVPVASLSSSLLKPAVLIFVITFVYFIGINAHYLSIYGHASPVTYLPEPNEVVDLTQNSLDRVDISFTERPELKASSIKVVDSNNERIDNNDLNLKDSDKTLSISLDKSKIQEKGVYTVNWLVLSKDDGHITKGSFVFSTSTIQNNQTSDILQSKNNITSDYSTNFTAPDNAIIEFQITPFKLGKNTFNLTALNLNGTTIDNIKDVYIEFNNPSKGLGPIIDKMDKLQVGEYSKTGSYLSQEGLWEIKITIQRIGEYDINKLLEVNLN